MAVVNFKTLFAQPVHPNTFSTLKTSVLQSAINADNGIEKQENAPHVISGIFYKMEPALLTPLLQSTLKPILTVLILWKVHALNVPRDHSSILKVSVSK